jgi:hypothetical protein
MLGVRVSQWALEVMYMPFRSAKQRRYMYAKHPKIAKRWSKKYGSKIRKK